MADGFNLSELQTAFGSYYRDNKRAIAQKLQRGNVTSRYMTVVENVINRYTEAGADMDEVLQAYQSDAEAVFKGDLKFTPNEIIPQQQMIVYRFNPIEIEFSWAAWLRENNLPPTANLMTLVFDRLQKKAVNDHEMKQIGKGVRVAPIIGTAGTTVGAMDGFLRVIAQKIAATKITPIKIGTFTKNTIAEYVQDMVEHPSLEAYDGSMMYCYMSVKNARWFRKDQNVDNAGMGVQIIVQNGEDTNIPNTIRVDGSLEVPIEGTNITVVGLPSMNGSDRIFITPKENFKKVVDSDGLRFLDLQASGFYVKMFAYMQVGVGFTYNELVWCNDQA
jgi:hypothetical protein